ncbi:sialin-like isoform X2 [Symsagittifera roscoffensis]|uniref:sialin-like isoform X2 n=1 Tax=Symsagittifera roscoffensis TaxID=84072 RepID=UPI00307C5093
MALFCSQDDFLFSQPDDDSLGLDSDDDKSVDDGLLLIINPTSEQKYVSFIRSARSTLAYMGFLGFFLVYSMRINISVALLDMVDSESSNASLNENCPASNVTERNQSTLSGKFDWTSSEQASVLGAFYYGYMITQIPSGLFLNHYKGEGGKLLYGMGILLTGLFTLLSPLASYGGVGWLIGLRVLEGVTEAATFPAFNHMMGKWVPKYERSFFSAFAASGGTFGFYVNGALAVIWYAMWCILISEKPETHPRISQEEMEHIKSNTSQRCSNELEIVPWKSILTSRAFYGLLTCHVCCNFTNYGLMSCLPQYLSNVLNFDISSNGFLSALPWLCCWISIQLFSTITDVVRRHNCLSTTVVRKVNAFVGTVFPGLFLILAGYAGCNATLAVCFIVIAMFFFGANWSGFNCNNLDIAPNLAGVLFAITNTFATIPGFVAPLVVGWITADNVHSEKLWRYAFFTFASVSWFGGLVFILFASGELQPWAAGINSDNIDNDCRDLINQSDHDVAIDTESS